MQDPHIGDIVSVRRRPGIWTCIAPAPSSPPFGQCWRVRRGQGDKLPEDMTVGDGDLTPLVRPTITPGMTLSYADYEELTVLSQADCKVILQLSERDRRQAVPGSGTVNFGVSKIVVGRGEIVSANINKFLGQS